MIEMMCPNCGYHYYIEGKPYETERCPQCGHEGGFEDFIVAQQ